MHMPTDLAERVSPALAQVARRVLEDPGRDADATLAMAQQAVSGGLLERMVRAGDLDAHESDAVAAELDDLVAAFGADIALVHLLRYRAREPLSTVIQHLLARDDDPETPVTLRDVRAAIDGGLLAELVGEGVIDPDDDDAVAGQLDDLVRAHGEEALAEELTAAEDETP
ncbi:MAG: hypothetical protein U5K43_10645 [Halofilum sp. (in: g-proteobacteria)]|nr:hypothetical protein [Halofilum sp. (in: g-proteobacteria)]